MAVPLSHSVRSSKRISGAMIANRQFGGVVTGLRYGVWYPVRAGWCGWTAEVAEHDDPVRTVVQRRADAVVEMATRSQSTPPGAQRPRPLFTVLVGYETFAGRICELDDGTVIAPGQLLPHLGEADIERIVFDTPDRILAVSQRRRFTGALRRAIQVRDRHCQHPSGCDTPAPDCDTDHITPWTHTKDTSQTNGRLLCTSHNRHPEHDDANPRSRRHDGPVDRSKSSGRKPVDDARSTRDEGPPGGDTDAERAPPGA